MSDWDEKKITLNYNWQKHLAKKAMQPDNKGNFKPGAAETMRSHVRNMKDYQRKLDLIKRMKKANIRIVKEDDKEPKYFHIVRKAIHNNGTEKIVGKATNKKSARRVLDRHDNKYGAYAHKIVPVYEQVSQVYKSDDNMSTTQPKSPRKYHVQTKLGRFGEKRATTYVKSALALKRGKSKSSQEPQALSAESIVFEAKGWSQDKIDAFRKHIGSGGSATEFGGSYGRKMLKKLGLKSTVQGKGAVHIRTKKEKPAPKPKGRPVGIAAHNRSPLFTHNETIKDLLGKNHTHAEVAAHLNQHHGTSFTMRQIKTHVGRNMRSEVAPRSNKGGGLQRRNGANPSGRIKQHSEFIKDLHSKGHTSTEIAQHLSQHTGQPFERKHLKPFLTGLRKKGEVERRPNSWGGSHVTNRKPKAEKVPRVKIARPPKEKVPRIKIARPPKPKVERVFRPPQPKSIKPRRYLGPKIDAKTGKFITKPKTKEEKTRSMLRHASSSSRAVPTVASRFNPADWT